MASTRDAADWTRINKSRSSGGGSSGGGGGSSRQVPVSEEVYSQYESGYAGYGRIRNPDGSITYVKQDKSGKVIERITPEPTAKQKYQQELQQNVRKGYYVLDEEGRGYSTAFPNKYAPKPGDVLPGTPREGLYFEIPSNAQEGQIGRDVFVRDSSGFTKTGEFSDEGRAQIAASFKQQESFYGTGVQKNTFFMDTRGTLNASKRKNIVEKGVFYAGKGLEAGEKGLGYLDTAATFGGREPISKTMRGAGSFFISQAKERERLGASSDSQFLNRVGGFALQKVGEKPISTGVLVGSQFVGGAGGLATVTKGTVLGLIAAPKAVRGYREQMSGFKEDMKFQAIIQQTDYEGGDLFNIPLIGLGVPTPSKVGNFLKGTSYKENLKSNLLASGYTETQANVLAERGAYEKRTQEYVFFSSEVALAESGANIVGGAGIKTSSKLFAKTALSPKWQTIGSYGVGIGAFGGTFEGGAASVSYDISAEQPIDVNRAGKSALIGAGVGSVFGGLFGYGKVKGGYTEKVINFGEQYVIDAPAEPVGDAITNFYQGGFKGKGTLGTTPRPRSPIGVTIDVSSSKGRGYSTSPSPNFGVSVKTNNPLNIFSNTNVNNNVPVSVNTNVLSNTNVKANTKTPISIFTKTSVANPNNEPVFSNVPMNINVNNPINIPVKTPVNNPVFNPINEPVDETVPVIKDVPPIIPPFGGGLSGWGRGGVKRLARYSPSLTASIFNIRSTGKGSSFSTGLGLRPLLGGVSSKKSKKKKSKKRK